MSTETITQQQLDELNQTRPQEPRRAQPVRGRTLWDFLAEAGGDFWLFLILVAFIAGSAVVGVFADSDGDATHAAHPMPAQVIADDARRERDGGH